MHPDVAAMSELILSTPVLVLDEDGEFRVDWIDGNGERQTGPKNILVGDWAETIVSGEFYLIPVPGTIHSNIDFTTPA